MNLTPVFASFVATDTLNIDNDAIIKLIKERQPTNEHGPSIFFNGEEPELQKLFKEASDRILALHEMFNLREDVDNKIYVAWANYGPNQYTTEPHHHVEVPDSMFCAVYYPHAVQEGYPLVFMNPNHAQDAICRNWVFDPNKEKTIYTSQQWRVQPKTGMLVIFPSWLYHYVMMEDNIPLEKEKRISLAFNTRFIVRE